jgi:hypothetical protein
MAVWDSAAERLPSHHSHPWLAEFLFSFDRHLRRRLAVFEYSHHPSCIFRLEITRAQRRLALRDGASVSVGQRVARLHYWNEHVPPMPKEGPTVAWALRMQQSIAVGLRELARYLATRPDLDDVVVICGDVPNGTGTQRQKLARIMAHYGFEAIIEPEHLSPAARLNRFAENILISIIVFAQNAEALRSDTLMRARLPIFLSRRVLVERFGRSSTAECVGVGAT